MAPTEPPSPTLDSSSTDNHAASDTEEEEENDDQPIAHEDDSVSSDSDTNLSVKPIRSKPMKTPPPVSSSKKRPTLSMTEDNGAGDVEVVAKERSHKKEEEKKKKKLKTNGGCGDLNGEDALCPTLAEVVAQLASEVKNGAATRKAFARALEMMKPENGRAWEEKWRRQGIAELEVYRRRKALEGELIAELEDVLRNAGRSVVSS